MFRARRMVSVTESEERLMSELLGDSRDRPIRRILDNRASRLIYALDKADEHQIRELCTADVTLINGVLGPEYIYKGVDDIVRCCKFKKSVTCIIITIVDRGRITCPAEVFREKHPSGYTQQRRAMILDIDEACKVRRIEMRPLGEIKHCDGDMDLAAESVEEIDVDNGL
ncbi:hypothetical protein CSUB01_11071 [Colletotrichum sublineola]|uniref:SnoaL-like domain-containing protein n=1 Tax=Colletotrichum sublineola TaxID=1173701 RepID=A0A066Y0L1_COLSU|nr:hypothetical protein CSUB01_11071 [Colletotrichum sublineola]